ncbi:ankyrin 2,3/unc44 [Metarhizium album ARSEF 1941]|uniref:Ankyrin 2,3/unc44 n=1 Tax=Metarhizium album (strain ARSEF 1941) TaxID=1081103 RepID=A0A0B2WNG0_METAS|nr:ankyrin 2,3/unc44 [Metarhizium album ARSEF 1941]KHN94540.1 ankyrin 2,3/unc44 [Metarhizium album ARSEF 1941]
MRRKSPESDSYRTGAQQLQAPHTVILCSFPTTSRIAPDRRSPRQQKPMPAGCRTAAMELVNLPTELLMYVAEALDRDRDINAFCRVNRRFYHLAVAYLYRHNATASQAGTSAILWAAKHENVSTAERALRAGVDVNVPQGPAGVLPLVEATRFGNARMVRLLLEKGGAAANVLHGKAGTVLHTAAVRWDMATATALLEHGANVDERRLDTGETPLHAAINSGAIMTGGATEMLRLLLDHGADFAATNFADATPLHCAASCGNITALGILFDYGAGAILSSPRTHDETPLHAAIRARQEEAARVLIQLGADVEATDAFGSTVFDHALSYACPSVLKMLLEKGVNVGSQDPGPNEVLVRAAWGRNAAVVKVLIDHGGGSIDVSVGAKAMSMAIVGGNAEVLQALIDAGADIHTQGEWKGRLVLHHAAMTGQAHVVGVLLRNGADVNARDGTNRTALHWAVDWPEVVEVLLAHGADATIVSDDGQTPVDRARSSSRGLQAYEMLLSSRAAVGG